jgi:hypothetical protein
VHDVPLQSFYGIGGGILFGPRSHYYKTSTTNKKSIVIRDISEVTHAT